MTEPPDSIEPIPLSSIDPDADSATELSGEIPLGPDPTAVVSSAPSSATPVPNRVFPVGPPGSPLPRIWKAEPEVDPDEDDRPRKKKKSVEEAPAPEPVSKKVKASKPKPKPKAAKPLKDGETKGVLIEETPNLDTHETRQRIRIAIGTALTAVFLLIGYGIYRKLSAGPGGSDTPIDPNMAVTGTPTQPTNARANSERSAQALVDRARDHAKSKNPKPDLIAPLLEKAVAEYPTTPAGIEAKAALERHKKKLSFFPDGREQEAVKNEAPPTQAVPDKKPLEVVIETGKAKPDVGKGKEVVIVPPANTMPDPPPGNAPPPPVVPHFRALPNGFHPVSGTSADESGWPKEIHGDRDKEKMVLVRGAEFIQGRDGVEPQEGPPHPVILSTYYIDQHEVTVAQFNKFQREYGRRTDRETVLDRSPKLKNAPDNFPVVMVNARDASTYAKWAGKRLPTEAQWEAAARTTDVRIYPWGNDLPEWAKPRVFRQIEPVMSYPNDQSPYGVFDMAGNVAEWTRDWYDTKYYYQFRNLTARDPQGPVNQPKTGSLVVKGGSKDWALFRREGVRSENRQTYLGFRCVLQVEGPGNAFEPPPVSPSPGSGGAPGQGVGDSGVPF